MNRLAVRYSYAVNDTMHDMYVYGFNCVYKYLNCQDE